MNATNLKSAADSSNPSPPQPTSDNANGNKRSMGLKVATYINAHKILVFPVVVGLMWFYGNWSTDAYIYLAMHGTYSILWLLKDAIYADRRFEEKVPLWIGVPFIFVPLAGYYVAPYLLISSRVTVPPSVVGLALFSYILGVFFHYVSDAQKYYTLRIRKGLNSVARAIRIILERFLSTLVTPSCPSIGYRSWCLPAGSSASS
jgi:hypothetical protein